MGASPDVKDVPPQPRLTWSLSLVWLAFFCDYILMTAAIPIFPLLDKPDVLIGALFAAKAAFQIMSSPIAVQLVDRNEKSLMVGGLALECLSVLVFATTFNYWIWFIARAVSGVASAAIISAGLAHLNKRYMNSDERAVAMGLATTGIVGGVCLGPLLGGALHEVERGLPFACLGCLELLATCLTWMRLPRLTAQVPGAQTNDTASGSGSGAGSMLRCPEANAAIACLESTVARYFRDAFGLSTGMVGAMFLLVSVPSCVMSGVAGPLGNRYGRLGLIKVGLLLQGLFTALGPKSQFQMQVISMLGIGTGMGIIDGVTPSLLGEVTDQRFGGSGKIFVLSNVAVQLGFVLGPLLGTALVSAVGFNICNVLAGCALLAYWPLLRLKH